ncbi:MAG: MFS transporter [Candidatus Thorarchaeota archaeon]|nr:MFS transporter [Candidatus Thorarchaeota archaeon]
MSEHELEPTESPCEQPERFHMIELVSYIIFGIGPLVGNAVLTLLGPISSDFLVDPTAVLVALPAFMFPFAIFQLFSGALSDSYGRVPVIVGGLIAFLAGLSLISISSSLEIFALGYIVSGIGFGFANPVLLALLSDCAPPGDIPKRMGYAAALASLCVGLGPFIAGQMARFGWQLYYLLILCIILLGLVSIIIAKRPTMSVHGETGLRALIRNLGAELRKGVVLLMLFTTFLIPLVYLATFVWTSAGLTNYVDAGLLGLLLLGGGIFGTVAGLLLGQLILKRGYGVTTAAGIIPQIVGILLFLLIGDITLPSALLWDGIAIILVGWAGGLLFPLMITYSQIISPERRGVLAGIVTFAFFLGYAFIPTIYEPLFRQGMTSLYLGIFGVTILLLVFVTVLYRKIEEWSSKITL